MGEKETGWQEVNMTRAAERETATMLMPLERERYAHPREEFTYSGVWR